MASFGRVLTAPLRFLAQALTRFNPATIVHGGPYGGGWGSGWSWPSLGKASWGSVRAEDSSIVVAAVRWIQRTFTEAPPQVDEWISEREVWRYHPMDEAILDLLERPNAFYSGATLWKATLSDRLLTGNAYWIKVRGSQGRVVQLWWAPSSTITPISERPEDFITYYQYSPGGATGTFDLAPTEVIRFPDGCDPDNPRLGLSPVRTLLREIYTDEEAGVMTAALLRNMGVPGIVIAPKGGTIGKEAAEAVKQSYLDKFTGTKRGEPLVLEGSADIVPFGFSPQQLELRAIRGLPEERVTAVLGINAAVLGLGAGLETTKVGATLAQYREEAFESSIIPMYRDLGADLTMALLPDFYGGTDLKNRRVSFDLSKIRVLQDDMIAKSKSLGEQLASGGITVAEYRRNLGYQVLPEHEIYLRAKNTDAVPTRAYLPPPGEPEPATAPAPAPAAPPAAPAPSSNGNGATPAPAAA